MFKSQIIDENRFILNSARINPRNTQLDEDIMCHICYDIPQEPLECTNCSTLVCKACKDNMLKHQNNKNQCPYKCQNSNHVRPHRKFIKILNSLKFDCENVQKGCDFLVNFENVRYHQLNECEFADKLQNDPDQNAKQECITQKNEQQLTKGKMNQIKFIKPVWSWLDEDNIFQLYNEFISEEIEQLYQLGLYMMENFLDDEDQIIILSDNGQGQHIDQSSGKQTTILRFDQSDIKWLWQEYDKIYNLFDDQLSKLIEKKYQDYLLQPNTQYESKFGVDQNQYNLNFKEMTQKNQISGFKRNIIRVNI